MLSHVFIGVNQFESALAFYQPLMTALGLEVKFLDHQHPWAGWKHPEHERPLFVIGRPFDGEPAAPGNGQLFALLAADRASVDRAHALALSLGAQCEGPPGLRPHYHADYYGSYFRDPEGNKLCLVCHHDR